MVINVRSESDKKLIGYLKKKSKKRKVHVYFNKKNQKTGAGKYIQGDFYSEKNKDMFPYKSSYELAYLHLIEKDSKVLSYIYEPFELYYIDSNGKRRIYIPDFMVLYDNGSILISEIKPKAMLQDFDVQAKGRACREYLLKEYSNVDISYCFITEKDLFSSSKEYNDFLKSIKNE